MSDITPQFSPKYREQLNQWANPQVAPSPRKGIKDSLNDAEYDGPEPEDVELDRPAPPTISQIQTETPAPVVSIPPVATVAPNSEPGRDITSSPFETRAKAVIERLRQPVVPLYPNQKEVHTGLVPHPLEQMSADPAKIRDWGHVEPDANVGIYAIQKVGGLLFLDRDGRRDLKAAYEQETGEKFPDTLYVRSSIVTDENVSYAKGHWYFSQTKETLKGKNISEDSTGGWFSLRLNNLYVAGFGSIHPTTHQPYQIGNDRSVLPMPSKLYQWLKAQEVKKPVDASPIGEKIPYGSHDTELHRIAGKLRQAGLEEEAIYNGLVEVCEKRCENYGSDYLQMCRKHAHEICKKPVGKDDRVVWGSKENQTTPAANPAPESKLNPEEYEAELDKEYPVIPLTEQAGPSWSEDIFYGPAGDVIKKVAQYNEAHPAGMLLDFLVAFGSMIGRGPYFNVNSTAHYTNEYLARVGDSSYSRKGGGRDAVDELLKLIDLDWYQSRVMSGFGSSEAIVYNIRDGSMQMQRDRKSGAFTEVMVPGVADKRLCIREGELASVFVLAGKPESRADVVLRDGWDGKILRNLVKGKSADGISNSAVCKEPHLSLSADTTSSELIRKMPDGADKNGFGNRFLYSYVYRVKLCPSGGPQIDWKYEQNYFMDALMWARQQKYIPLSATAKKLWNRLYTRLDENRLPGLAGEMTSRGAAHIRRLALIYAMIDKSDSVETCHLYAARDLWEYCQESASYIFNKYTQEQLRILDFVSSKGQTSLPEIREGLFHRNKLAVWIKSQVTDLAKNGYVALDGETVRFFRK